MTHKKELIISGVFLLLLACGVSFFALSQNMAYGAATRTVGITPNRYINHTFFTATTTNATSTNTTTETGYLVIEGAKKVTMYFTHGGTATTSTAGARFSVQTSEDGTTWTNFNKLIGPDVSSTATSTYTIQGATSTVPVALDLSDDTFFGVRCISAELAGAAATDGEHTCTASASY